MPVENGTHFRRVPDVGAVVEGEGDLAAVSWTVAHQGPEPARAWESWRRPNRSTRARRARWSTRPRARATRVLGRGAAAATDAPIADTTAHPTPTASAGARPPAARATTMAIAATAAETMTAPSGRNCRGSVIPIPRPSDSAIHHVIGPSGVCVKSHADTADDQRAERRNRFPRLPACDRGAEARERDRHHDREEIAGGGPRVEQDRGKEQRREPRARAEPDPRRACRIGANDHDARPYAATGLGVRPR